MYVGQPERGGLAHAESAAVEDFEDGTVPAAVLGTKVNGFYDGAHFVHGENLRKVLSEFRGFYPVARVFLHLTFFHAPGKKAAEGTQEPCAAALGESCGRCLPKVCGNVV